MNLSDFQKWGRGMSLLVRRPHIPKSGPWDFTARLAYGASNAMKEMGEVLQVAHRAYWVPSTKWTPEQVKSEVLDEVAHVVFGLNDVIDSCGLTWEQVFKHCQAQINNKERERIMRGG